MAIDKKRGKYNFGKFQEIYRKDTGGENTFIFTSPKP